MEPIAVFEFHAKVVTWLFVLVIRGLVLMTQLTVRASWWLAKNHPLGALLLVLYACSERWLPSPTQDPFTGIIVLGLSTAYCLRSDGRFGPQSRHARQAQGQATRAQRKGTGLPVAEVRPQHHRRTAAADGLKRRMRAWRIRRRLRRDAARLGYDDPRRQWEAQQRPELGMTEPDLTTRVGGKR